METECLILSKDCPPLVLKNLISDWPASSWTPQYLSNQIKDQRFTCKVAPKDESVLWETDCIHEEITLQQFVDWNDGKSGEDNPLKSYDRLYFSCYIDYKYMKDLFSSNNNKLKDVDWSKFGLEGRGGSESTLWIGSDGCYTNCHFDTYGFNLVAQIYGRKRWILFPPSDTSNMYPTRIPYEESSVFSDVNVKHPDLNVNVNFKLCHPHVVILEPGDVLYVPRHWWHHVECMDTSISINTWVEMEEDTESHVDEAITRLLFNCMMDVENNSDWINPGEELQDHSVNLKYLQEALMRQNKHMTCTNLAIFARHIGQHVDLMKVQNTRAECHGSESKDVQVYEDHLNELISHNRKRSSLTFSSDEDKCSKKVRSCKNDDNGVHFEKCTSIKPNSTQTKHCDVIKYVKPMSFNTYCREIINNGDMESGEKCHSPDAADRNNETKNHHTDFTSGNNSKPCKCEHPGFISDDNYKPCTCTCDHPDYTSGNNSQPCTNNCEHTDYTREDNSKPCTTKCEQTDYTREDNSKPCTTKCEQTDYTREDNSKPCTTKCEQTDYTREDNSKPCTTKCEQTDYTRDDNSKPCTTKCEQTDYTRDDNSKPCTTKCEHNMMTFECFTKSLLHPEVIGKLKEIIKRQFNK